VSARIPGRGPVVGAILAGGLVAFACSGRRWRVGDGSADPVTGALRTAAIDGTQVAPAVRACALAIVAGAIAVLIVGGRARSVVASAVALVGLGAVAGSVVAALSAPSGLHSTAWPWLAAASGLFAAVGATVAAIRGPGWTSSRSDRYDSPAAPARDDDAWAALDRGEDPTA